jgi:uncharacterized membrane protein
MAPARTGRIDPVNGTRIEPAEAALRVLERRPHRAVLKYLFDHPAATRQDIMGATGLPAQTVSRALGDLATLRYVTVEESAHRTLPDHFTADRSGFVSDLAALRLRFIS